jgi:Fe-S oxidoreductase/nitrate reductase gamma subunit
MEGTDPILTPTREIYGNIVPWMRVVFYLMMFASMGWIAWQVWHRARLWNQGQPGGFETNWRVWLRRLAVYGAAQKRVHRKSLGAVLHLLLFSGFVVLTIGTTLLAIADQGPVNFHKGLYYLVYEFTMDVFGVALCLGCVLAFYRRAFQRPPALGHVPSDWAVLAILLALGVTGFLVEALRIHYTQVPDPIARWSAVGHLINQTLLSGFTTETTRSTHLILWWVHAILVAVLFLALPVTRFLHVLTGPANIAARPSRPMGALQPLAIEQVEATGQMGVSRITDFTRQQLLSLDACMECGRCEEACPAWATSKPLTPKGLVQDLRRAMAQTQGPDLHGGVIQPETLWSCTMCQACVQECPVLIGHVDLVSDMRRHLVAEGQIAGPPAKAMALVGRQGNPFGRPAAERLAWAAGLDVPTVESQPDFDYLLWVGCAASYDPRAQKVARATVQLLRQAGIRFAVMGRAERCTGDPARRLGDEFLFQESARANIESLSSAKVRKIVTPCPHCLNSLKNEYPAFGGDFEVRHHSELLSELVAQGRLKPGSPQPANITLHDPCYLARVNGETKAPRSLIQAASSSPLREMPRHGAKTFCCGAGGGRMWADENPQQRVSRLRATEAVRTGATTLATACPFCLNMMTDAMNGTDGGSKVEVLDVAEILLRSQSPAPTQPQSPPPASTPAGTPNP